KRFLGEIALGIVLPGDSGVAVANQCQLAVRPEEAPLPRVAALIILRRDLGITLLVQDRSIVRTEASLLDPIPLAIVAKGFLGEAVRRVEDWLVVQAEARDLGQVAAGVKGSSQPGVAVPVRHRLARGPKISFANPVPLPVPLPGNLEVAFHVPDR